MCACRTSLPHLSLTSTWHSAAAHLDMQPPHACVQACWAAAVQLRKLSPAFNITFKQAFAFVTQAFRQSLRSADQSSNADDLASASLGSEPSSISATADMTPAERAAKLCLHRKAAALEQHVAVFAERVTVTPQAFRQALLESLATWLDAPACQLFGALLQIHVQHIQGKATAEDVALLPQLLRLQQPCLGLGVSMGASMATGGSCEGTEPGGGLQSAKFAASDGAKASTEWLTKARLDNLAWLEARVQSARGLAKHVRQHRNQWWQVAQSASPWNSLPGPFDQLKPLHRLLLCAILNADHIMPALQWFAPGQPAVFQSLDSVARVLCAIRAAQHTPAVTLLHAQNAADPVEVVQLLASMQASGAAFAGFSGNAALNLLSPRSGNRPPEEAPDMPQVVTLHLHSGLQAGKLASAVLRYSATHTWLLLPAAHTQPRLVQEAVQAFEAAHRSAAACPDFRLFLSCPTFALAAVPQRSDMHTVMVGGTYAVAPRVAQMCHMADLPVAAPLHLAQSAEDAGLSRSDQAAVQQTALGAFLATATAETLAQRNGCMALPGCEDVLCAPGDIMHAVHVVQRYVTSWQGNRMGLFAQLGKALSEVCMRAACTV